MLSDYTEPGEPTVAINMWTQNPHRGFSNCNLTDEATDICGSEPMFLRGHASQWPAVAKWTLPFLQQKAEEHGAAGLAAEQNRADKSAPPAIQGSQFAVGTCAKADHIYPEMFRRHVRQPGSPDTHMLTIDAMRKAMDDLKSGGHKGFGCSGVAPLDRINPSLGKSDDIALPPWMLPPSSMAEKPQINLWITTGKVQSGLHFDESYNSLTVLQGTKYVYLFAPSESHLLYQTVQGSE